MSSKIKEFIKLVEARKGCTLQDTAALARDLGGDYDLVLGMNDGTGSGGGPAICIYLMALIAADLEQPE